jgi:hypothetical protein
VIHLSLDLPNPASPWWKTWEKIREVKAADLTETALRYEYLTVNVELVINDVEIIPRRRNLTLVDLALSLRGVVEQISDGDDAAFDFTERAEVIRFEQLEDGICVTSTRKSFQVLVDREELVTHFKDFLQVAHGRIVNEIPDLEGNLVIGRIVADWPGQVQLLPPHPA